MKKLISIVSTIALLATLMSVPRTANAALKKSFSWDNGTANGGLYGKTSGDLGTHLGTSQPRYAKLTPGEWHDIEIHFGIPANSMDIYLDYERVASGVKFRTPNSFNQWTVNVDLWHRVITPATTISRSFRPQTGVITFETQIIFTTKKDGSRVTIGNSGGVNKFYDLVIEY